jgi:hypothetical protein
MKKWKFTRTYAWIVATLVIVGGSSLSRVAAADIRSGPSVPAMSIGARRDIERRVDEIANRIANSKSYFEDDHLPIHIKSSFDPVAQSLVMAIDERFGPVSGYVEMENLQSDITNAIWPMLENIHGFWGLDWRYGGKDLYFWFPGDRRPAEKSTRPSAGAGVGLGTVLINEGHGYYFHHGYSDWRFQREPANGIIEDKITAEIATPLWAWMGVAGIPAKSAREATFGNHDPSGKPLYLMAARYLLEKSFPDRPDIWHSLPDDVSDLREYKEDIRSRPLYANALGVDGMISIHTNADIDASTHGTRVFVQPDRPESAELASMALCYMREHIQANKQYADFSIARTPQFADKGENRLANMPAIIVELGFHTNASDAAALKDPVFVASAMRGLAKGYRLFREGERCQDLEIELPPRAEGVVGEVTNIELTWKGHPDFPMDINAEGGWGMVLEDNTGKRADLNFLCTEEDVAKSPFAFKVTARDFAGIESKPVEVMVTCANPAKTAIASDFSSHLRAFVGRHR